ncbi:MAG: AI-2E family transporter [Longimicrobiaceae bacterium]
MTGTSAPEPLQPTHLYRTVGVLLAAALIFWYFREISRVFLFLYISVILAVALNPLAGSTRLGRNWLAALSGLGIVTLLGLIFWFGVPALGDQLRGLIRRIPEFQAELAAWGDRIAERTGFEVRVPTVEFQEVVGHVWQSVGGFQIFGRAGAVLEGMLIPLILLLGGLFALSSPNKGLLVPLMRSLPRDLRPDVERMFQRLAKRLRGWLRAMVISMLVIGTLVTLALAVIGVPYALLLGVINALAVIVPVIGPTLGAVPAVLVAFLDDPMKALWATLALLAINQFESNLITPMVMSREANVHPMITLFALFLFGGMFGFLGVILSIPLVLLFGTAVEVLWVERTLGADKDRIEPVVQE